MIPSLDASLFSCELVKTRPRISIRAQFMGSLQGILILAERLLVVKGVRVIGLNHENVIRVFCCRFETFLWPTCFLINWKLRRRSVVWTVCEGVDVLLEGGVYVYIYTWNYSRTNRMLIRLISKFGRGLLFWQPLIQQWVPSYSGNWPILAAILELKALNSSFPTASPPEAPSPQLPTNPPRKKIDWFREENHYYFHCTWPYT